LQAVTYLTDTVWRQLDSGAGRLSRRTAMRLWLAGGLAFALLVVGALGYRAGLVVARLEDSSNAWEVNPGVRATYDLQISNAGWLPVTVTGAGRSGPGMELLSVDGTLPAVLKPGESAVLALVYRVTDCAAVPSGAWPIPVRVDGPWFSHTVFPFRRFDPIQPWQQQLVETWCHPP
jgi:hypothetical protein